MGLRWLQLCYFAEGGQPRSKIAQLQSPRDHSFNPETQKKAIYICFIYIIHIFIVHWLVKRFLEKWRKFILNIMFIYFFAVQNGCVQLFWFAQNSALTVCLAYVMHKCAIIVLISYSLEKTIYSLKKTFLRFWSYFCRIASLFLITWRTCSKSMNKNIWMLHVIFDNVACGTDHSSLSNCPAGLVLWHAWDWAIRLVHTPVSDD